MENSTFMKKIRIDSYVYAFAGIAGLFILITFQYVNILTYFNPHFIENLPDRGQFGDAYGALNSLFSGLALAGVIISIIMQRKELKLQRDEMTSSRYEFILSRYTNLVYSQLEKFEKYQDEFNVEHLISNKLYTGRNAIIYLNQTLVDFKIEPKVIEFKKLIELKEEMLDSLKLLHNNKFELKNFFIAVSNCISTLDYMINDSDLSTKDKEGLKYIFKSNVGFELSDVLENILELIHMLGKHSEKLKFEKYQYERLNSMLDFTFSIDGTVTFFNNGEYEIDRKVTGIDDVIITL